MKKTWSLVLATVLATGVFAGCAQNSKTPATSTPESTDPQAAVSAVVASEGKNDAQAASEKILNVFTWDGYFPQDIVDEFTEQTGIQINFSNFESNEEALTKLQAANAGDYDVVVVSDYMVEIMSKLGNVLKKLDKSKIPNFENIDPNFQSKFYDPENLYTIPYGPGTPLIVYDPAVCKVDIQGYADLWNPALKDSVVLMDSSRVVIGIALKTMGKSFNESDPAVLEEAKKKLMELKPNVRTLAMNNLQDVVVGGEASVGFMFTSQVATAKAARPDLKIVYPKEGLGFGIDTLTVPANAPHEDNAYAFLNHILDPKIGARISEQILYLCPNKASAEFLSDGYKNNPGLVIPEASLKDVEFVQDVGTEVGALYEKIWTEFKQQ